MDRMSHARSPRRTRSVRAPTTTSRSTAAHGSMRRAARQSAGIYHIRGNIQMSNDSYLFGDGVTLVFDQGANFDVQNGGGFVLNYGSLHNTPTDASSGCNLSSMKRFDD